MLKQTCNKLKDHYLNKMFNNNNNNNNYYFNNIFAIVKTWKFGRVEEQKKHHIFEKIDFSVEK